MFSLELLIMAYCGRNWGNYRRCGW